MRTRNLPRTETSSGDGATRATPRASFREWFPQSSVATGRRASQLVGDPQKAASKLARRLRDAAGTVRPTLARSLPISLAARIEPRVARTMMEPISAACPIPATTVDEII